MLKTIYYYCGLTQVNLIDVKERRFVKNTIFYICKCNEISVSSYVKVRWGLDLLISTIMRAKANLSNYDGPLQDRLPN